MSHRITFLLDSHDEEFIRAALEEGEESGIAEDFDPATFVQKLNDEYDAEE